MSDKEYDFQSALLLVAIALYAGALAALFAGMTVTKPNVAAALSGWARDYGSLIAGFPVLIAVVVARQQLEAGRRQHIATIKRSFQKELDAIQFFHKFARSVEEMTFTSAKLASLFIDGGGIYIAHPTHYETERHGEFVSTDILDRAHSLRRDVRLVMDRSRNYDVDEEALGAGFDAIKGPALSLRVQCEQELDRLSQYWS